MRRRHTRERKNFRALCRLPPLLGERAGVRANFSSELIFGVGGGFSREKQFRLVTSARLRATHRQPATALATILERTLTRQAIFYFHFQHAASPSSRGQIRFAGDKRPIRV